MTRLISVKTGGAAVSQEYSKALEEMMDKIKRGASLRPVLKPVKKVVPDGMVNSGDPDQTAAPQGATLIRLLLKEQFDLGLHCLRRPV